MTAVQQWWYGQVKKADEAWINVALLIGADSGVIADESSGALDVLSPGTATVNSTSPLVSSHDIYLDGLGEGLLIDSNPKFGFGTASWTWEATIKVETYTGIIGQNTVIFDFRTSLHSDGALFVSGEFPHRLYYYNGSTTFGLDTGVDIPLNTKTRVALTYDGSTLRGFVNGVKQWESSYAANFGSTRPLRIGSNYYALDDSDRANMWIDEIRITPNVCRYTDNYVPVDKFPRL
jgi:hypothetical protein